MSRANNLSAEEARRTFSYDSVTGRLHRLKGHGAVHPSIRGRGYYYISHYLVHRLAWLITYGEWPGEGMNVDHINGDKLDNRLCNLRICTPRQSSANTKGKSALPKGVQYRSNLYRARITIGGKGVHLGYYRTPEEAHAAYMKAAIAEHGEFACGGR